ncbi:MAG: hypothetical protein KKA31_05350 [Candidatus Margulisbacteria bacterium]|nr:hypothetical protein [Candidatus Margulisiibacteriota bacterium]
MIDAKGISGDQIRSTKVFQKFDINEYQFTEDEVNRDFAETYARATSNVRLEVMEQMSPGAVKKLRDQLRIIAKDQRKPGLQKLAAKLLKRPELKPKGGRKPKIILFDEPEETPARNLPFGGKTPPLFDE